MFSLLRFEHFSKFSMYVWGKKRKMLVFTGVYVCVKAKLTLVRFFSKNFFELFPYAIQCNATQSKHLKHLLQHTSNTMDAPSAPAIPVSPDSLSSLYSPPCWTSHIVLDILKWPPYLAENTK